MTGLSGHDDVHFLPVFTKNEHPQSCCSTGVPGVTQIDNAGPTSSERKPILHHPVQDWIGSQLEQPSPEAIEAVREIRERRQARPLSCAQCGDDPQAIVRAFKAGMQAVAWDTYAENVRAGELKADLEAQWHAHVRRYGE